jgi:cytochrome c biogenesis protein CcdA
MSEGEALQKRRGQVRFGLVVGGTAFVALLGYVGFRVFPELGNGTETGAALMALAAATGFAAFFSPCAFPLMLATLGRQADLGTGYTRLKPALRFAFAASIGAVVFLVGFGLLLSLGGEGIARQVTFTSTTGRALRATAGALLITMGLVQLGKFTIPFFKVSKLATPIDRRRIQKGDPDRFFSHVLYGFGYLIAGFG